MGQNLIEKIAQRYAVDLPPGHTVRAGDFLYIRPAHVMTHDNTGAVMAKYGFATRSIQGQLILRGPSLPLDGCATPDSRASAPSGSPYRDRPYSRWTTMCKTPRKRCRTQPHRRLLSSGRHLTSTSVPRPFGPPRTEPGQVSRDPRVRHGARHRLLPRRSRYWPPGVLRYHSLGNVAPNS